MRVNIAIWNSQKLSLKGCYQRFNVDVNDKDESEFSNFLSKNLIAIEAIIENALTCQLIIIQVPGRQEHELTGELNDGMWELNLIKFDSEHWSILYKAMVCGLSLPAI